MHNLLENWDTEAAIDEYIGGRGRDTWVPAGGGTEVPFVKDGTWWLYVWNDARGIHGYYDYASDLVYYTAERLAEVA